MRLCGKQLHDLDDPANVQFVPRPNSATGSSTMCRPCKAERSRQSAERARERLRQKVYEMYGGKCACPGCTETRRVMLSVDHVQNDGAADRRALGNRNYTEYARKDAARKYQPEKYQLLCHNCNFTKGRHSCLEEG